MPVLRTGRETLGILESDLPVRLVSLLLNRCSVKLPERKRPANALTFPPGTLLEFITLSSVGLAEFWWLESWVVSSTVVHMADRFASIVAVTLLILLLGAF